MKISGSPGADGQIASAKIYANADAGSDGEYSLFLDIKGPYTADQLDPGKPGYVPPEQRNVQLTIIAYDDDKTAGNPMNGKDLGGNGETGRFHRYRTQYF